MFIPFPGSESFHVSIRGAIYSLMAAPLLLTDSWSQTARLGRSPHQQPTSFQLTANYRSHHGIVSCAQSVVALITEFWPSAIDMLAEERGVIDGWKPLFITGQGKDSVYFEKWQFLSQDS